MEIQHRSLSCVPRECTGTNHTWYRGSTIRGISGDSDVWRRPLHCPQPYHPLPGAPGPLNDTCRVLSPAAPWGLTFAKLGAKATAKTALPAEAPSGTTPRPQGAAKVSMCVHNTCEHPQVSQERADRSPILQTSSLESAHLAPKTSCTTGHIVSVSPISSRPLCHQFG